MGSVVEMESAYILAAASGRRVPVVAVRAISDAADEDLPVDFRQIVDSHGHLRFAPLLKELALHPHRLPLLVQFGRQSRAAAGSLADFLDQFIPLVASKWPGFSASNMEEVTAT
jgi:adenosylhomocysteine nucleosidase